MGTSGVVRVLLRASATSPILSEYLVLCPRCRCRTARESSQMYRAPHGRASTLRPCIGCFDRRFACYLCREANFLAKARPTLTDRGGACLHLPRKAKRMEVLSQQGMMAMPGSTKTGPAAGAPKGNGSGLKVIFKFPRPDAQQGVSKTTTQADTGTACPAILLLCMVSCGAHVNDILSPSPCIPRSDQRPFTGLRVLERLH